MFKDYCLKMIFHRMISIQKKWRKECAAGEIIDQGLTIKLFEMAKNFSCGSTFLSFIIYYYY